MPTYEYECRSCRHLFEAFQGMNEKPLTKCPECGKKVKRLISTGAGLIFKGSGFYCTDYRSEDYKKKAREESRGGASKKKKPATGEKSTESSAAD